MEDAMKTFYGIVALTLAVSVAAVAAEPTTAELDKALKEVAAQNPPAGDGALRLIEQTVFDAVKDAKRRRAVEGRLLATLAAAKTFEAKSFLCRQLRTIGTARSIPQLEAMLTDPQLSHMARYALARMEDPAAVAALHRTLGKTSGKCQVGIIYSLAARRCRKAVGDLVKLMGSSDAAVAAAASRAVGRIGGDEAVKALEAASAVDRRLIDDALLMCAEGFLRDGRKADAARIYTRLYSTKQPKHVRIGALAGLAAAQGERAAGTIVEAIRSDDPQMRASAIALMATVTGPKATKAFVDLLPRLAPEGQSLVLRALGARGDAAAAGAIAKHAKSAHETVRMAALDALGGVGDASVVGLLARAAASAGGEEQKVARASLVRLRGAGVDAALLRSVASDEAKVRVEIIRALAGRGVKDAVGELLKAARDADAAVRGEAIRAMGAVADESQLVKLVELAARPRDAKDRAAVEAAVAAVMVSVKNGDRLTDPVVSGLADGPAEAKPTLVRLLGRAGTPKALAAVRKVLKSDNAAATDAAVRALAGWPDASCAADLLTIARRSDNATHKVLVLRGYVRMAGMSKDPTRMYVQAMALAKRPEDKKLVLGGLGTAGSKAALELVERYIKDEQLQTEAGLAAVQIADKLRQSDPTRARAALKNVLKTVKDRRVRGKAAEIVSEMDQYEGYILVWLVSPRYVEKGKDSRAVFEKAFPPEKADGKDVKWKPLTRGIGSWDINLEAALGEGDHCGAYVRTRVWSAADKDVRLELGSDDAIKVWLSGKPVHANYVSRGIAPRQDIVKVKLRKGWNDLMLKVVDHEGGWAFCCRLRDPDGAALDGLKVEAK